MNLPTDLSKNTKRSYAFKACEYIFYRKQKVQALFILFCPGLTSCFALNFFPVRHCLQAKVFFGTANGKGPPGLEFLSSGIAGCCATFIIFFSEKKNVVLAGNV